MTGSPEPCRINGVDYPSHRAAARALGVTPQAISMAISRGKEDRVSLGAGRLGNANGPMIPVEALGRKWRSKLAMSKAIGAPYRSLCRWLDAGDADRILSALMHADTLRSGEKQ